MTHPIKKSFSGLRTILIILHLIILMNFTHTTIVWALPAAPRTGQPRIKPQIDAQKMQPDLQMLRELNPDSWPVEDITYEYFSDEKQPLDDMAVHMAALHCAQLFSLRGRGAQVPIPDKGLYCGRGGEGSDRVAVRFDGIASAQGPEYMFAEHMVFGIHLAITELTRVGKAEKLKVWLKNRDAFVGSVTFEGSTGAPKDPAAVITSVQGLSALNIVVPPGMNPLPPVCPAASTPAVTSDVQPTGESGLSLQSYTMAAIRYYLLIAFRQGDPKSTTIDAVKTSPAEALQQMPGYGITIHAGYEPAGEERKQCPLLTTYILLLAMTEVAATPQLIKEGIFVNAQIKADGVAVGHLWVENSVWTAGAGTHTGVDTGTDTGAFEDISMVREDVPQTNTRVDIYELNDRDRPTYMSDAGFYPAMNAYLAGIDAKIAQYGAHTEPNFEIDEASIDGYHIKVFNVHKTHGAKVPYWEDLKSAIEVVKDHIEHFRVSSRYFRNLRVSAKRLPDDYSWKGTVASFQIWKGPHPFPDELAEAGVPEGDMCESVKDLCDKPGDVAKGDNAAAME